MQCFYKSDVVRFPPAPSSIEAELIEYRYAGILVGKQEEVAVFLNCEEEGFDGLDDHH